MLRKGFFSEKVITNQKTVSTWPPCARRHRCGAQSLMDDGLDVLGLGLAVDGHIFSGFP